MEPFVAHTHRQWYDFLSAQAPGGRLDEVNFWFPRAQRPPKNFAPGEPIFFRLGAPERKIAGCGFFAYFNLLPLDLAWETFGVRNGAPDRSSFYAILHRTTEEDLALPVACMGLLDAHFWPDARWLPWGRERGYADTGLQMGRTERDPANVALLLAQMHDMAPSELRADFEPLEVDERKVVLAQRTAREGQGTFRLRLLDAYGACAISGEHTEPVLDAAHIQPYLGPRSNHPRNGLILTKEFHALFDRGLVTIGDDFCVRVSSLIQKRWNNGKRYKAFDGQPLAALPKDAAMRPSPEALEWHRAHVFERVA